MDGMVKDFQSEFLRIVDIDKELGDIAKQVNFREDSLIDFERGKEIEKKFTEDPKDGFSWKAIKKFERKLEHICQTLPSNVHKFCRESRPKLYDACNRKTSMGLLGQSNVVCHKFVDYADCSHQLKDS